MQIGPRYRERERETKAELRNSRTRTNERDLSSTTFISTALTSTSTSTTINPIDEEGLELLPVASMRASSSSSSSSSSLSYSFSSWSRRFVFCGSMIVGSVALNGLLAIGFTFHHGNGVGLGHGVLGIGTPFGHRTTHAQANAHSSTTAQPSTVLRSVSVTKETAPTETIATTATATTATTEVVVDNDAFVRPEPDKRSYRYVRLAPNGLEVLLVSDPTADMEAASVHVRTGHFNDPPNRAGLAHFHEHMLFLGTEKYPEDDEYEKFLSRNGGSSNAYTDMEDTNYYFSVAPLNNEEEDDDDDDEDEGEGIHVKEPMLNGETELEEGTTTDALPEIPEEEEVSAALAGSLDRFAQFFIAPTFKEDAVEREMRAVDSEYVNSITNDNWRDYSLLKASCHPTHPFSKFGCGNYETLSNGGNITFPSAEESGGSSPRDDLIKFWETYYHAQNMRVAVLGKASLNKLQQVVETTFRDVRKDNGLTDTHSSSTTTTAAVAATEVTTATEVTSTTKSTLFVTEHERYGVSAFDATNLGIIRQVVPVVEKRVIKILFEIPPVDDPVMRASRPHNLLSHLFGHESPGSLHAVLNDDGLINGLSTGVEVDTADFSMFSVTISLTNEGMVQREKVLDLVFQWIQVIRSSLDELETYQEELQQMSAIGFRFRENGDPSDFVSSAADALFHFPVHEVLLGPAKFGPYDRNVFEALMQRMVPSNALVTVVSSNFTTTAEFQDYIPSDTPWQQEHWYHAKYRQTAIPPDVINQWTDPSTMDERLRLPEPNKFIPRDFSLRSSDPTETDQPEETTTATTITDPQLLETNDQNMRLWHKLDRTYKVPKTFIRFQIVSNSIYRSPRSMTYCRLYQKILSDDLNSYVYDASIAGCNYSVSCQPNGFMVTVSGYSEKVEVLLQTISKRMLSILDDMNNNEEEDKRKALQLKFTKAKESLLRETKNVRLDTPYSTNSYNSRLVLEERGWHIDSYIEEMESETFPLTLEGCAAAAYESLKDNIRVECLCMGNIDDKGAQAVGDIIRDRFLQGSRSLADDELPVYKSMKLLTKDEASSILNNKYNNNNNNTTLTSNIPIVFEQLAYSEEEENHAVEVVLQAGSGLDLGIDGVALLELITYVAYSSAFAQLRTREQLGYIVSAYSRKTAGGARGMSVVVQGITLPPPQIEERIEAWIVTFRQELSDMPPEEIAMEAQAVVAQLLEKDTSLSDEIGRHWGSLTSTFDKATHSDFRQPVFDVAQRVAQRLTLQPTTTTVQKKEGGEQWTADQLKQKLLEFYDHHFLPTSPHRRAMSARVYGRQAKNLMSSSSSSSLLLTSLEDAINLKQYLSTWSTAPFVKHNDPL